MPTTAKTTLTTLGVPPHVKQKFKRRITFGWLFSRISANLHLTFSAPDVNAPSKKDGYMSASLPLHEDLDPRDTQRFQMTLMTKDRLEFQLETMLSMYDK